MLDFLMDEKDMTPTEVFELGLRMAYNLKKYTWIIVGQKIKLELLSDKKSNTGLLIWWIIVGQKIDFGAFFGIFTHFLRFLPILY